MGFETIAMKAARFSLKTFGIVTERRETLLTKILRLAGESQVK